MKIKVIIKVHIETFLKNTLTLGFKAPKHISIHRKEIYLEIQYEGRKIRYWGLDYDDLIIMAQ